jgi:hypothetical protein
VEGGKHVTHLIIRKSKQFLPQSIPILHTPFLTQEINYLICTPQEGIPIPPDRIGGVAILHFVRIPVIIISTFLSAFLTSFMSRLT